MNITFENKHSEVRIKIEKRLSEKIIKTSRGKPTDITLLHFDKIKLQSSKTDRTIKNQEAVLFKNYTLRQLIFTKKLYSI